MKLKQKKQLSRKKIILIAIVIVALALVITVAYLLFKNSSTEKVDDSTDTTKIDYSEPTEEQKKAGEDAENQSPSDQPPASTLPPQTPASKKPANVLISSALQDGSGVLRVRTIISYTDSPAGTCTVTVTQNGQTLFTASAKSEKRSEYSTCQGFDITKTQLKNAAGLTNVSVTYSGTIYEGSATTQVTLQ